MTEHDRLARLRQDARRVRVHADAICRRARPPSRCATEMLKAIKAAARATASSARALLNPYSDDARRRPGVEGRHRAAQPHSRGDRAIRAAVPDARHAGRAHPDAAVKEFTDALVKAGQRAEYVQVGGASHAFFDWKPDEGTKATFAKYGVYYAAAMKASRRRRTTRARSPLRPASPCRLTYCAQTTA